MLDVAQSIFKKCELIKRQSIKHKIFTSFLHFASDSLNDPSIYPFWSDITALEKDYFARTLLDTDNSFLEIRKSISQNKSAFWNYMSKTLIVYQTNDNLYNIIVTQDAISAILRFFGDNNNDSIYSKKEVNLIQICDCPEFHSYLGTLYAKISKNISKNLVYRLSFLTVHSLNGYEFTSAFAAFHANIHKKIIASRQLLKTF